VRLFRTKQAVPASPVRQQGHGATTVGWRMTDFWSSPPGNACALCVPRDVPCRSAWSRSPTRSVLPGYGTPREPRSLSRCSGLVCAVSAYVSPCVLGPRLSPATRNGACSTPELSMSRRRWECDSHRRALPLPSVKVSRNGDEVYEQTDDDQQSEPGRGKKFHGAEDQKYDNGERQSPELLVP
jgi:hypothetical protein